MYLTNQLTVQIVAAYCLSLINISFIPNIEDFDKLWEL